MLLNLSNHPSTAWSEAQLKAAKAQYGELIDLPFPNIPPTFSRAEVDALAADYEQQVLALSPSAVHLMGEMTFTCNLVQRLLARGIPSVASTSERRVVEEADGKKTLLFQFVQFRGY